MRSEASVAIAASTPLEASRGDIADARYLRMSAGYTYDHAWTDERVCLAGLESLLDAGTRGDFVRSEWGPGSRCLEIGAGAGGVAFWLAERVAPERK
jgi:ubiquinone/menaquinone biosynthesis C-methylase UbiE